MIERLKYLFFNVAYDWQLGIVEYNLESFINNQFILPKINWIKCPFNVFQADPFGVEFNNQIFIFYEEFNKSKNYGIIKCLTLDTGLNVINDCVIIDDGLHKSFPYIFKEANTYFMLPENGSDNQLFIYECIDFPYKWQKKIKILDLAVSDAILIKKETNYFLLYTKAKNENENKDLFIRTNTSLLENWTALNETKVKSDLSNSRNAGKIISYKNKDYRFAQNCANRYGESIKINHLNELSTNTLKETLIGEISNKKYGIHTINFTENYTLLDRQIERLKIKTPFEILKFIFQRLKSK